MQKQTTNEQILDILFSIGRCMREGGALTISVGDLTIGQLQALIYVAKKQEVTMSDIAAHFGTSLPTATSLVDKLVKAKYLQRKQDKNDRRIVHVVLSQRGNEILQDAMKQRSLKAREFLSYLNESEKNNLLNILTSLRKRLEKTNEK